MPVNTVGPCRLGLSSAFAAILAVSVLAAPAGAANHVAQVHAKRHGTTHHKPVTAAVPSRAATLAATAVARKTAAATVARKAAAATAAKRAAAATAAKRAAAAAASTAASVTGACADAGLVPEPDNLALISAATLCLINEQRAAAGVASLRANAALAAAASSHSVEMVALDYFDHVSPSGEAPIDRAVAAGYLRPGAAGGVGENIAAVDDPATPAAAVAIWMGSAEHRANILDPDYRDSGIGVTPGIPAILAAGSGATYTQDFGETG
jgi:uncharacterized protein YkwD